MNLNIASDRMTRKTLIYKRVDPHGACFARDDNGNQHPQLFGYTKITKPHQDLTRGSQPASIYKN